MPKLVRFFIAVMIFLFIWMIPSTWIPINNLTTIEHRVLALFILAALLWVLEPIPIFATSVLVIVLQLFLISDQSLSFLRNHSKVPDFGTELKYQKIMETFGSPIILLFIGGFFLADAATKYRLDLNLARILVRPFGKRPHAVLFGIMLVTAMFSMFMSNTATTAMMLAILTPVIAVFPEGDKGKIAMCLAIPFAANIGGLGTPVGTPPNAIAMNYLQGISFATWMAFAVPYVILALILSWLVLIWLYPAKIPEITLDIQSKFQTNWRALVFYFTFIATIILWILEPLHSMNSYVVAMIPVAVFTATGIITAKDLNNMEWNVLWLLTGGIALGQALEQSGLAKHIIASIPFDTMSAYMIVFMATMIAFFLSNFMSHTAAANLLLPIMSILGATPSLTPLGGGKMLILVVTFTCSMAMAMPISTPPNAMAHAAGRLENKDMLKAGLIIGIGGIALLYATLYIVQLCGMI